MRSTLLAILLACGTACGTKHKLADEETLRQRCAARPGQKYRSSYLRWMDDGAREAYYKICGIWNFQREA